MDSAMRPRIDRVVPFVHVKDMARSMEFYARLGFMVVGSKQVENGSPFWAFMRSKFAELMLARADGPLDPTVQGVLLYMYCGDVRALRAGLLKAGVRDGGKYVGTPLDLARADHSEVFDVEAPPWMPAGEIRLHDPDGYCVLIGQP